MKKKIFEYEGFEDFYDFFRDMQEICEPWNDIFNDIDDEFQNTVKVTIEVLPLEEEN